MADPTIRSTLKPGMEVDIVLKKDQPTGRLTRGIIQDILTNSEQHHQGIKVRLADGQVGRVKRVLSESLAGMKLWDAILAMRGCESITALSHSFTTSEVKVGGETVTNPDTLLEDGHYIVKVGATHSVDLYVAAGAVDTGRSKVMRKQ